MSQCEVTDEAKIENLSLVHEKHVEWSLLGFTMFILLVDGTRPGTGHPERTLLGPLLWQTRMKHSQTSTWRACLRKRDTQDHWLLCLSKPPKHRAWFRLILPHTLFTLLVHWGTINFSGLNIQALTFHSVFSEKCAMACMFYSFICFQVNTGQVHTKYRKTFNLGVHTFLAMM